MTRWRPLIGVVAVLVAAWAAVPHGQGGAARGFVHSFAQFSISATVCSTDSRAA